MPGIKMSGIKMSGIECPGSNVRDQMSGIKWRAFKFHTLNVLCQVCSRCYLNRIDHNFQSLKIQFKFQKINITEFLWQNSWHLRDVFATINPQHINSWYIESNHTVGCDLKTVHIEHECSNFSSKKRRDWSVTKHRRRICPYRLTWDTKTRPQHLPNTAEWHWLETSLT